MIFYCILRLGFAVFALLLLLTQVTAHLDLTPDELVKYHRDIKRDSDSLSKCLQSPQMQEHNARMLAHQNETLWNLRMARGINSESGNSRCTPECPHD